MAMNNIMWIKEIEATLLTDEEVKNPVLVIKQLFEHTDIQYLKKDVWECLKAAMADKPFSYLNEPLLVFNMQKEMGRLCDAMFLLFKIQEAAEGDIHIQYSLPGSKERVELERKFMRELGMLLDAHKGRILRLTKEEVDNPHLAIRSFFDYYTPSKWKALFSYWSEHALSKVSIFTDLTDNAPLLELEHLERIIEVAWLLNKNSIGDEVKDTDSHIAMAENLKETPLRWEIQKSFINFLESAPASRLNRNLRKIFLDYLSQNINSLPSDIEGFLLDFYHLTNLLDVIESKPQDWHKGEVDEEMS